MNKRVLRRNNRGQFMILIALGIVLMMITLASLLAATSISPLTISKHEFREVTTQVSLNFRKAVALSLAGVSKELDFKASIRFYSEFTKLEEYPKATEIGCEYLSDWQNTTLMQYPALGVNLSTSNPTFECDWDSFQGYSKASANITFDILNYGFYGWKEKAIAELTLTTLDLKETDGNITSFYFSLTKEYDNPVSGLTESLIKILYQDGSGVFREAESSAIDLTFLGSGNYLVTFYTNVSTISDSLDLLKTHITNMSDSDFKNATYKSTLLNNVDEVIWNYNSENLTEAYFQLQTEIRPRLDPADENSWVVEDADTAHILSLIDDILSQLMPKIKIILQDDRGIIVGSSSTLIPFGDDNTGPKTINVLVRPNPTNGWGFVELTAQINDLTTGWSNIASAEYFIDTVGSNGSGTLMNPTDGSFDSPTEEVRVEINVTNWSLGNYTLYVRGKDAKGNWGDVSSVMLKVIETPLMHVASIDMSLETSGWWFWRRNRAVAVVTIVDSGANPVEGATVYGHWSGLTSGDVFGVTDINGKYTFKSDWVRGSGTFTFTVDDVVLSGWIYDQSSNGETSDSITA